MPDCLVFIREVASHAACFSRAERPQVAKDGFCRGQWPRRCHWLQAVESVDFHGLLGYDKSRFDSLLFQIISSGLPHEAGQMMTNAKVRNELQVVVEGA